ncbi:hypothetical protein K505DRAFT_330 [Melanomma pulvis-pyrius CBS 109.77]|uniref:Uncharacterized protein n=1 Tax=Melanomma pulvis-pyrius CBS 109.77 TaxID=1314802 RepID=A0A6A6XZY9_9PLEO|nr:hypothetical protein K505DRAFT_330 [Melanomma pulvis-pyrius CBS 109.77]
MMVIPITTWLSMHSVSICFFRRHSGGFLTLESGLGMDWVCISICSWLAMSDRRNVFFIIIQTSVTTMAVCVWGQQTRNSSRFGK